MTGVAATQQQEEYRDRLYRQNHHGTNLLKARARFQAAATYFIRLLKDFPQDARVLDLGTVAAVSVWAALKDPCTTGVSSHRH